MRHVLLTVYVMLAGCAIVQPTDDPGGDSLAAPGGSVTLGDQFHGGAIAVASGGTVAVELTASAGTPYSWVLAERPAFLRLVSTEQLPSSSQSTMPPRAGRPQVTRFIFQATAQGTGRLTLVLRSVVNERDVAQRWTGTITVQ